MRIGIITPAWNVAPFIQQALASVLAQSHADWRIIVVDDGSTDDTLAVVGKFSDQRITLICQKHGGVSAARNRGLAAVEADALLFLDADDWLAPNALSVLVQALEGARWAVAAVAGYSRVPSGHDPCPTPPRRSWSGDVLANLLVRNLFANGGHVLVRRDAAQAAGFFRDDLHYGEDWEYWVRIALQGEFIATTSRSPVCFVRERAGSAYRTMAARGESFQPCMDAVFGNPLLLKRFGPTRLACLRRRAEAETAWVVGRELLRHGEATEGLRRLRQAAAAAPTLKRIGMAAAAGWLHWLPEPWRGRFRPYPDPTDAAGKARGLAVTGRSE